jgi:hypothetical protein
MMQASERGFVLGVDVAYDINFMYRIAGKIKPGQQHTVESIKAFADSRGTHDKATVSALHLRWLRYTNFSWSCAFRTIGLILVVGT